MTNKNNSHGGKRLRSGRKKLSPKKIIRISVEESVKTDIKAILKAVVSALLSNNQFQKVSAAALIFGFKVDEKKFNKIYKSQYKKGLETYGKTLADCDYKAYNWETMALEDLVDFSMYVEKKESKK